MLCKPMTAVITVAARTAIGSWILTNSPILMPLTPATWYSSDLASNLASSNTMVLGPVNFVHALRGGSIMASKIRSKTRPSFGPRSMEDVFDLERATIRLDGLDAYGVVTALLMAASLSLVGVAQPKPEDTRIDLIAKLLLAISVSASVLAGSHATVVYTLVGIYSKTALGLGKDEAFVQFMARTAAIRKNAFEAFLISLGSFNASFVLSMFLNLSGQLRWYVVGVLVVVSLYTMLAWYGMIHAATAIIFS